MENNLSQLLLESYRKRFLSYRELGEKTFSQLDEEQLNWSPDEASNSIAVIVKHLSGNMLSRFTDFLNSDGEKPWRARDAEFEAEYLTKDQLLEKWNKGWQCLMDTLNALKTSDLIRNITIRGESHSVVDALNRQLAHYPYHIGQMIQIAKALKGTGWQSLSIAKGQSGAFNEQMKNRHP